MMDGMHMTFAIYYMHLANISFFFSSKVMPPA